MRKEPALLPGAGSNPPLCYAPLPVQHYVAVNQGFGILVHAPTLYTLGYLSMRASNSMSAGACKELHRK